MKEPSVAKRRNNNAPGPDGIPTELIEYAGNELLIALHKIIWGIWNEEQLPNERRISNIYFIHKNGDKLLCKKYRGMSLLCIDYKVLTTIIKKRTHQFAVKNV